MAVRKRWHSFSTNDSVCLSLVMYEKSCLKNTHEASDEDTKPGFPRLYSTDEFSLTLQTTAGGKTNKQKKAIYNSLHDCIEVLGGHASLWVRQAADYVWEQVVDGIVL